MQKKTNVSIANFLDQGKQKNKSIPERFSTISLMEYKGHPRINK